MRSATPADYEAAILAVTGADLKLLLLQSMDFFKKRQMYDGHFGGATQSFLEACRAIVAREPESRMGRLIRDLFRDSGIEGELTPAAGASTAGGVAVAAGGQQ